MSSWSDTLAAYNAASVAASAAAASAAGQRPRGTNHMTAAYPPIETERSGKNKDEEKEYRVQEEMRKLYAADAEKQREKQRAHRAALRAERAAKRAAGDSSDAAASAEAAAAMAIPRKPKSASLRAIPRFYVQRTTSPAPLDTEPPAESDGGSSSGDPANAAAPQPMRSSLPTQVRRESRTRYLESRAEQLLDDRELALLWDSIQAHSVDALTSAPHAPAPPSSSATMSPPPSASPTGGGSMHHVGANSAAAFEVEKRLTYEAFLRVASTLPEAKAKRYFKPSLFLEFPQDGQSRISSRALWRLVSKKIQLTRLRISLTCYDDVGYGYLREQDLENYVYDQLGSLPPLASVERDFYPYYVFTAVRKFIFTLDPSRRGKLRIRDIVHSAVMLEFDALRYPHGHHAATKKGSWFSAAHTQEVYAIYLGLDANQNGMLSREEFRQYNGGNLTTIFIDGLFSEYRMYPSAGDDAAQQGGGTSSPSSSGVNGSLAAAATQPAELEMDYKTFLDFVLAMEYKQSPASLAYFFRILDLKAVGYLDAATIRYWFRAVAEKMASLGHEPVSAAVVASEIFDMVCPAVEGRITLQDLVASKCGHTVVSILIDVNGFWKYDNRENLMHTENADNDE